MPELPEVECVRLSLKRLVMGRRILSVRVTRPGVIRGDRSDAALLAGDRVADVLRHGKQLAVVGSTGRCVCVHLGMSGQLCSVPALSADNGRQATVKRTTAAFRSTDFKDCPAHTHILWRMDDGQGVRFTDPRRFGGVWTFAQPEDLRTQRWSSLGADALTITPGMLHRGLSTTKRGLKAALLDQHLVAGLGNIYVDELLFGIRLHPQTPACSLSRGQADSLVRRMRTLLSRAVERGGSSLRDYVDAENRRGTQQDRHRVYGRSGQRCRRGGCSDHIVTGQVAGRTTAWCPSCQPSAAGVCIE